MKPRLFRSFVTIQYYKNRDEYDSYMQKQPHSFEEYVRGNITTLKKKFREFKKEVDK